MSVIHALEVIEIDEDYRELVAIAMGAVNLRVEHEIKMARIIERGAIVRDREFMDALHVPGVFDGNRRIIRERFKQRQLTRAEALIAHAVDQLNHAETLVAEADWNGDNRTGAHFRLLVHLREETRVLSRIGHDNDFAGLSHPAGNSLPNLYAQILQRIRTFTGGDFKIKFIFLSVHQKKRPGVGPKHFIDFFHNGAEDLVELKR